MDELGNSESPYFALNEPEERKNERAEEMGKVREGMRLLEEMIERFEARAEHLSSVDAITETTEPEKFMHQVSGNRVAKAILLAELEYLESLKNLVE